MKKTENAFEIFIDIFWSYAYNWLFRGNLFFDEAEFILHPLTWHLSKGMACDLVLVVI